MPNLEALFLENLTKGKSLLEQGHYEEAIAYLERAYRIKPDDVKVLNLLGTAYFKAERLDSAEEIYEILARKNPNIPVLHSNLGMIRLKKKDWEGAEMAFQRVVELQPDNQRAYGYLGLIYEQQGHWERALAYYERAGAEGPAERVRARLRALRGVSAVSEEPVDEADVVAAEPWAPSPSVVPGPAQAAPHGAISSPPEPGGAALSESSAAGDTTTRPLEEVIRALQSQPMPWQVSAESPVEPPPPSPEPSLPTEAPPGPSEPVSGPTEWGRGMVISVSPPEFPPPPSVTSGEAAGSETPGEPAPAEEVRTVGAVVSAPAEEVVAPAEPSGETPPVSIEERLYAVRPPSPEVTVPIPTGRPVNLGIYAREQLYVYPPVGSERFLLLEPHLLEVVLSDRILFREGSLVGYSGDLRFSAVEIPGGPPVVMAQGFGLMFLAYERRSIHLISLNEEAIYVAMPCFLVAQATLRIQPRVISEDSGRMFSFLEVSGTGTVGFVIRSKPLILKVLRHMPAVVHSDAVVAWTGTMRVAPVEDPYSRALIRTYSETAVPLRFEGAGDLVTEQGAMWGERRNLSGAP